METSFLEAVGWLNAGLLASMAGFALQEAKSSSLIPKSLFLWPLSGFLFGLLCVVEANGRASGSQSASILLTGIVMLLCSVQALLVNIKRITRWPSGMVWLGFVISGIFSFAQAASTSELLFQTFLMRATGLVWCSVGVAKVASDKSSLQEGRIPIWIQLLFVQSLLIASSPF